MASSCFLSRPAPRAYIYLFFLLLSRQLVQISRAVKRFPARLC